MRLAIKGHPTRGKEVIEILEMLGGKNPYNYKGNYKKYYLISHDNSIYLLDYLPKDVVAYTLEEFEELYPYKVGDKVIVRGYKEQGVDEITSMIITYDNDVKYKTKNHRDTHYFTADSFKTENKKDMDKMNKAVFEGNAQSCDIMNDIINKDMKQIKIGIPKGYEFFGIDDDNKIALIKKQPQYPKNYIECAKILDCFSATLIDGYKNELLEKLQVLFVCRDAYWKIAGEQMGLGKPWEPDWNNQNDCYYAIKTCKKVVCLVSTLYLEDCILAFPTAEMRDAFFENFKDLIEQCKELL